MLVTQLIFWFSLAVIVYTYLGYPLFLAASHLLIRRESSHADDAYTPSISIVLAAFNEVNCIRQKLENCLGMDYPREKLEILVGSDGSDDGTDDVVQEYSRRGVVLFSYRPRRGKMATVNRLVREAANEICVFSDVAELFDRDAFRKLVRHFADPQIGAVTGNHIYHKDRSGLGVGTRFYWKFQRFLQGIESRLHSVFACDGTIYACRRDLYPFPADNTINDDVAVPLGILTRGKRIIFESEAIARGNVLKNTQRFLRQKIRSQSGKYQNFIAFPNMFVPWPALRFWTFMSHSVLPVLVPWFLLLLLATNAVLTTTNERVYLCTIFIQIAFYLAALVGAIAQQGRFFVPLVAIPYYFVTANLGSLIGFFAFVSGAQRAAWRKVE